MFGFVQKLFGNMAFLDRLRGVVRDESPVVVGDNAAIYVDSVDSASGRTTYVVKWLEPDGLPEEPDRKYAKITSSDGNGLYGGIEMLDGGTGLTPSGVFSWDLTDSPLRDPNGQDGWYVEANPLVVAVVKLGVSWYILDTMGTQDAPVDLTTETGSDADTTTWDQTSQTATDGVTAVGARIYMPTTTDDSDKPVLATREFTADSLGHLKQIVEETVQDLGVWVTLREATYSSPTLTTVNRKVLVWAKGDDFGSTPHTITGAGADGDELVGVTINDTSPSYLATKLVEGDDITLTVINPGGNETLSVAATNDKVRVSDNELAADYLGNQITGDITHISVTANDNPGGDEIVTVAHLAPGTFYKAQNVTGDLWLIPGNNQYIGWDDAGHVIDGQTHDVVYTHATPQTADPTFAIIATASTVSGTVAGVTGATIDVITKTYHHDGRGHRNLASGDTPLVSTSVRIPQVIDDLADVDTTGLADDDFLRYNNGTGLWEPWSFTDVAGYNGANNQVFTHQAGTLTWVDIEEC